MTTPTVKTLARLTLVTVLAASGTALADHPTEPLDLPKVTVSYRDLNVANPEGARVLYNRIRAAAQKVCGPTLASWYPGVRASWNKCYEETVDRAVKDVNRPMLTGLHQKRISVARR